MYSIISKSVHKVKQAWWPTSSDNVESEFRNLEETLEHSTPQWEAHYIQESL